MYINYIIVATNNILAYYNLFILLGASSLLTQVYPEFLSTIKIAIIAKNNLNCYGHTDNGSYFCKSCYSIIIKKKIPKFRSVNCINISFYQKYSDIFSDLTLIEKVFIVYTYPIMLIIKLRPSSSNSSTLYLWIQSHIVILLQNSRHLFTIFFSNILASYNMICIAEAHK